ncbi:MAG TPA: hypothetical protein VLD19_09265, partial [Chitinophagaceae bacterium]|nr:hypothetical protein [Chitinophagaceae bacterium]
SQPDAAALLQNFYSQLEPPKQEFFIQNNHDTTLLAKEGTRLIIPAGAFVDKAGNVPRGTVKIVLTEFYNYDKMVAAGLGTSSNGQQLVSGGMLYITAGANGQELQIQPSVNVTIKMPTNNYDARMQLFTGITPEQMRAASFTHAGNPHGDTVAFLPPATAGNKRINWLPMPRWDDNSWRPTLKVINYSNERVNLRYRKNKTIAIFRIRRHNKSRKEEIKAELEKRYGYYYDKIVLKYPPHETGLFANHHVLAWQTVGDSAFMKLDEAVKLKLISAEDSLIYVRKVAADSIRYFSRLSKLRKEYTYNLSKLGWINCDRFLNDPGPKIQFTIDLGPGYEARNFQSSLVFARYRSVIPGYYSQSKLGYSQIPEGEPVHLICVGIKDGKVVACIHSFTTSAGEINSLHFEETTPEQFKQKLRDINLISMN